MDVVFFGDGIWATRCLQRVIDEGHRVRGVALRRKPTDRTLGELARKCGIRVCCPESVNASGFVEWVQSLKPDLNISVSYDQIVRRPLIDTAPLGFVNCHAGKLPYYRGRNVINWALINNEPEIGLTVHYMDQGIDTGDIIVQRTLPISCDDAYGTVLQKVQEAFPGVLAEAMQCIARQPDHRQPQAHLEGTYFSRRLPGDEWIDWRDTSLNIYNKIRAISYPGPGARTLLNGRILILWQAHYEVGWPTYIATPGEVVGYIPEHGVRVKTGDSTVLLENVQFEGASEPGQTPNFRIGTRFGIDLMEAVYRLHLEVSELRAQLGTKHHRKEGTRATRGCR